MDATETIEVALEHNGSPDKCVSKMEFIDVEFAKQLSVNPDVDKDERAKLKRMLKNLKKGTHVDVLYKLGKHCKHGDLGRWIATQGIGLQSLSREIRNAISVGNYIDIDMVNAQPSLLRDYCVKRGWACESLKKYIAERDEMIQNVMDFCGIDKREAKDKIVAVIFGQNPASLPTWFKTDFYNEIRKISELVWKENEKELKWLAKQPNHFGKGLAYVLQTEERRCLEAMDVALTKRGRSMDTYIHDGGLVRKTGPDDTLPRPFLDDIEEEVRVSTGYKIRLLAKPMETSWEKEEEADDNVEYSAKKKDFETEHFKLMYPSLFIRMRNDDMYFLTFHDLSHQRHNYLLENGKRFIDEWTKDPNIRTYEKLEFAPKVILPPNVFNLFTKFHIDPQEGGDISRVMEVLRVMCNSEQHVMDYVEKWCAHIIQKPYIKTQTAIVVQGQEGIGKDTYWNFVGSILGGKGHGDYFYNTKTPENDVFHLFNSGTERSVLVKFEEADFKTNATNKNKLKGIIVSPTETYRKKGHDGITMNDYRNFVMTTNEEIPVVVSDSDRRFVLIHSSEEKRENTAFWGETHRMLADVSVKAAYHHRLLNMDLTGFVPNSPQCRPITDYYKEVKQSLAPFHAKWFYDHIMRTRATNAALEIENPEVMPSWIAWDLNKVMKDDSKFDYSVAKFGRDMKLYTDAGVLSKKKTRQHTVYTLDPEKCLEFLKSKNWIPADA